MSYVIGLDLGGTNLKYGLIDHRGTILYESIRPTYPPAGGVPGIPGVFENIIDAITEVETYAASKGVRPEGIGIGVPAIVDGGLVIGCEANLPELEGMPLGSRIAQQRSLPVWVDNDANLMGLAEWKFGAARGQNDVIFLTIGTGIGGAIVVNGKLYTGHRNRGAELGHIIVDINGLPCGCGGRGCLEAHASVQALIADYKKCLADTSSLHSPPLSSPTNPPLSSPSDPPTTSHPPAEITGKWIVARYLENQPAAVQAMNHHFDYLGAGIAGLINIFAPRKLIIGGGISEAGNFYIDAIRSRAMDRAMKQASEFTTIEAAQLGNKAGFMGAAAFVFNSL
jgi:glucokinase